jgi:hypothetical protein
MFPSVTVKEMGDKADVFVTFFYGTILATAVDFSKLLLWCFIGGFVERFVPDVLDSMADKGSKAAGDSK